LQSNGTALRLKRCLIKGGVIVCFFDAEGGYFIKKRSSLSSIDLEAQGHGRGTRLPLVKADGMSILTTCARGRYQMPRQKATERLGVLRGKYLLISFEGSTPN
jgi:hypothetical protein